MKPKTYMKTFIAVLLAAVLFAAWGVQSALAQQPPPPPSSCTDRYYPDLEAVATPPTPLTLLDPLTVQKYVNTLPNALDRGFIFAPNPGTYNSTPYDYQIGAYEVLHDPGLGFGPTTTVWGYGQSKATATYPARTFVVNGAAPDVTTDDITVRFTNNLTVEGTETGTPLNHLFPVDSTLEWADPLELGNKVGPYCGEVPLVTHLHGGHTDSLSDGLPDAWFTPGDVHTGRMFNPVYTFDNSQEAATVWYHDHALGITRLNVYAGLAGFYIIRDANEAALSLPGSPYGDGAITYPGTATLVPQGAPSYDQYEVAMVIQDRQFYQVSGGNPQLYYLSMPPPLTTAPLPSAWPEFFGDVILVNGKAWPKLDVEQNRWYRFRILNGADSAFYALYFDNPLFRGRPVPPSLTPPIYQIGTDLGFLDSPVQVTAAPADRLVIGPGERMDLLVKFLLPVGTSLTLRNDAAQPYPFGVPINPATVGQIMQFRVIRKTAAPDPFAATVAKAGGVVTNVNLRPQHPSITTLRTDAEAAASNTRQLILFEAINSYGRLEPSLGTFDGILRYVQPITEIIPTVGDTEVWEIYNLTPDAHPIHLHLVHFLILDRQVFTAVFDDVTGAVSSVSFTDVNQNPTSPVLPGPNEAGLKDTVQAYPWEVTRVIATFDKPGEYVWHCHILSHEDHEMMRPYFVGDIANRRPEPPPPTQ